MLNISSGYNDPVYLFQTRSDSYLKDREKNLRNQDFDQDIITFGYRTEEQSHISSLLTFKKIKFIHMLNLPKGKHELTIRNSGLYREGEVVIEIRIE